MPRTIHRLTALGVTRAKKPGMMADGGGLYLQVGEPSAPDSAVPKSWIFRYKRGGKDNWMGLGSAGDVTLERAREEAVRRRRQLKDGIDPLAARDAARGQAEAEAAQAVTFKECADRYIKAHEPSWKNAKHRAQWKNTLTSYAEPVLGPLHVSAIGTGHVLEVLEPIWTKKAETSSRVRGRIEAILDWATARGYRKGENPARWRGHMAKLLPGRSRARTVKHHPALPYDDLPTFMASLRTQGGTAAKALEFTILTAARTSEVIGATSDEIRERLWTVPAERIKGSKEHRVPLSAPAIDVVESMKGHSEQFLFPGGRSKRSLSSNAMLALLERMGRDDLTVHGFRSTFRDWAAERTNYPREVAEMALAHVVSDKTEAAYRRGDLFEKRRRLMDEWAKFCGSGETGARGKVVSLSGKR